MKYAHQPKIVFSDIDGTLLNEKKVLSSATIAAINRLKNSIPFVLISSRMPKAMEHLRKSASIVKYPLVAYNGALVLAQGKAVLSEHIDNKILEAIIQFNTLKNIHLSLYNFDQWYVPRMDYWAKREIHNTKTHPVVLQNDRVLDLWKQKEIGAHKIMCMADPKDIDSLFYFLNSNFSNQLHIYRPKSTYIELAPKQISKKTAISFILDNLYSNISKNSAVAFGDNYNDIEMLQWVGYGIAVANAKPEVIEIASETTAAGIDDGVAKWLNKRVKTE